MNIFRFLLELYRSFLFKLFGKKKHGILLNFIKCQIKCEDDISHFEDIVHPSIKEAIIDGGKGCWWMVYTPYYNANPALENPILCYALDKEKEIWKVYNQVVSQPSIGYNSDPALFFDANICTVLWREYETERTKKDSCSKAVYAKQYFSNAISKEIAFPLLIEADKWEDRLVSPAFIKYEDMYYGYAMHLKFKNERLLFNNKLLNSISSKILSFFALLYIYNQQKSFGISIWKSDSFDHPFQYIKTTIIKNKCKLYTPWHLDVFVYENKLYAVIQTSQCNADIVLAVSENFEEFSIYPYPLVTSSDLKSIGKIGLYKPTAFVENGIFNLYVSLQDVNNRKSNRLYKSTMPFKELLRKIDR